MECKQQLKWLMLAVICPLIAASSNDLAVSTIGAPSFMSKSNSSCPKENLNITGGSFVLSNGYLHGSLLRYICPNGYYPSIRSQRCQYGLWTSTTKIRKTPECKKITCPNPHVFENGEVIPYKHKYYVNDTTTYSCPSDYTFRGSAVRVCKPNGKWSGSTPICGDNSDHCPDPGVPPGSSRTGSIFKIGNKVTYRCESPLTLIGSKVRVCQDGGQWSGTEPQCYDQQGKKITMDQSGKLDIYIAVDASDSIDEEDFTKAKTTIKLLIEKISYYPVSPNYEILIFATDVTPIIQMRNFKLKKHEITLERIFEDLDKFTYDSRGGKTGTNIAKVYSEILESMIMEKNNNATAFSETHHIIILFTDGEANMGGNPKRKVDQIKRFFTKNDPNRENLDLYVFGLGEDVNQKDINDLVSNRDEEKHFFKLRDLTVVQEMFDDMIDESTSVGLCGVVWEGLENKRRAFPWLAQINIARPSKGSICMGSLVTSSYILTAAHCFKFGDTPDKITVKLEKDLVVKVKNYAVHPAFDLAAKQHMGIQGYYEFDVALIQLEKPAKMTTTVRPICIPCTRETNAALKLSESEGTCRKHGKVPDMRHRDACFEDAKKAEGINVGNAREVVTDNFLCSGGTEPKTDDVACKGEAGGATYVNKKGRVIQRDACFEDAKKAEGINVGNAREVVTDNFLCSGGTEPKTDDVACKGEAGGATYVNKKGRVIQYVFIHAFILEITCPNPHVFENGEVIPYKDKYYVNDTTTYSCHSDYMFRGSAVRVCKPNGKWSGSTPICGRDSDHCPDPGVPPGSDREGNMFNINDKVTYRCERPLTLIGSKVRVCQDGGQWSGTEPQCYADFTYDTPEEASEAFSSSLKSNLAVSQQYEQDDQQGKKISLDQGGKLDIYIAVDASGSIVPEDFDKAKTTIKMLIEKISYYPVSPNYEILIFATDVTPIIQMRNFKLTKHERSLERIFEDLDKFTYDIVKVKKYAIHPAFDLTAKQHLGIKQYYEFDVALIQLEKPVKMTTTVQPICIPCTRETNAALKLSESEGTCRKHGKVPDMRHRDACVEDAKKAEGIIVENAREVVTDNFLCSGGTEPKTDDVACKGEAGGATYVNKKGRVIQVGVISWGVKNICKRRSGFTSASDSRDYHSNLFSEKIRSFLKEHLENDNIGNPLTFL
ncbi:complement factor B-like protein [Labeo rohita]|uniref:C3/C5 convertase n=1 Tax=Labeo rohita TaxID=84645 RepID=A0A498MJ06_LABRO|nr:complement factor B-like protein [Labeo rohita]